MTGFQSTERRIRDLDGYEELMWLVSTVAPVHHTYAMTVEGVTEAADWQRAWRSLNANHVVLSATIRKRPGSRPTFVKADRDSPIEIKGWSETLDLPAEAARALNRSLDGSGELFRLTVFHSTGRCSVLLTAHHAVFDGRSSLLILDELLSAVVSRPVRRRLLWRSRNAVFGLPEPAEYTAHAPVDALSLAEQPALLPAQIRRRYLSTETTAKLIERARQEGCSVHGALIVAATTALTWHRPAVDAMRCASPVDLRSLVGGRDILGMMIHNQITRVEPASAGEFWSAARAASLAVQDVRQLQKIIDAIRALDAAVSAEKTAQEVSGRLLAPAFDLMVSNKAVVRFQVADERLRVVDLWSAVCLGAPSVPAISVLTVGGQLGMTLVQRDPIETLLDEMTSLLAQAVADR
jgi:hypothetical protein